MVAMKLDKWWHYTRARLLEIARRPEEAIAEFRRALEFDPGFRKAANALGYRYAQLGRHTDAVICFESVVRLDAADAIAHYNLGFNYDKTGALEKAVESFRTASDSPRPRSASTARPWMPLSTQRACSP
jgi:Flp pilus assembly protein TadD